MKNNDDTASVVIAAVAIIVICAAFRFLMFALASFILFALIGIEWTWVVPSVLFVCSWLFRMLFARRGDAS